MLFKNEKKRQKNKKNTAIFIIVICYIFLIDLNISLPQNYPCDTPPSTIAGNAEYKVNWHFYWLPSNPQTIERNSQETIGVFGGFPPFVWTVSGSGFTLESAETDERSNILVSDSTACGAVSVTVTDKNGYRTVGSLRCSSGKWSAIKSGCVFGGVDEYVYEGGAAYSPNGPLWSYTTGKYKQYQGLVRTGAGECFQTCTNCPELCANKASTSSQYQCSPCLNQTSKIPCQWFQNQGHCCTAYEVTYNEWICE